MKKISAILISILVIAFLYKMDYLPYDATNFSRYIEFMKQHKNLNLQKIVTLVNAEIDKPFYTVDNDVEDPNDLDALVNKYHKLADDFVHQNLVEVDFKYTQNSNRKIYLRKEAYDAYQDIYEEAIKNGLTISIASAYRSISYQKGLYDSYVKINGAKEADTYSAKRGYFEHNLGLDIDYKDSSGNFANENLKEYLWLINNSYKYGFIIRYTQDNEWITGYI